MPDASPPRMSLLIRPFRMAIAVDDSEYAQIVLVHALDQALRHDVVALHFLTVVPHERDVEDASRRLARQILEEYDPVRDAPGERHSRLHVRVGDPIEEITAFAGELHADLLVVGRFGAHDHRQTYASAIVEASPCPTLVVGLVDRGIQQQCDACAAVRTASSGDGWFCEQHRGDARFHMVSLLPMLRTL